jgi:hypothetical protein
MSEEPKKLIEEDECIRLYAYTRRQNSRYYGIDDHTLAAMIIPCDRREGNYDLVDAKGGIAVCGLEDNVVKALAELCGVMKK